LTKIISKFHFIRLAISYHFSSRQAARFWCKTRWSGSNDHTCEE